RRHAAFDGRHDPFASAAMRQIGAEPHRNLGLDPNPTEVRDPHLGWAAVDLALEHRAITRLVDTAELLHNWRREPDLVADHRAAPWRLDRLVFGPHPVRL